MQGYSVILCSFERRDLGGLLKTSSLQRRVLQPEGLRRGTLQTCHHQVLESLFLQARSRWHQSLWPIWYCLRFWSYQTLWAKQDKAAAAAGWEISRKKKQASSLFRPDPLLSSGPLQADWDMRQDGALKSQIRGQFKDLTPSLALWHGLGRRLHFPALILIVYLAL